MSEFGRHMHTQGAVLIGKLEEAEWVAFLRRCTEDMEMSPVGEPKVWRYPVEGGKGGTGATIVQPITESCLILDTWEFSQEPHGAYLQIMSCRSFGLRQLIGAIDEFGLDLKTSSSRAVLEL